MSGLEQIGQLEDRDSTTESESKNDEFRAEFPSTSLNGWEVETYEEDVIKFTSPPDSPSRTALVHYAPLADFELLGREFSIREQWKAEVICNQNHFQLHCETFESKRDAVDDVFVHLHS